MKQKKKEKRGRRVPVWSWVSLALSLFFFYALAKRVKFFEHESLQERLLVFPARLVYECRIISEEMKTMIVWGEETKSLDSKGDNKWIGEEDDRFVKDITKDTNCPFPVFSVLNELGELYEGFEVPAERAGKPYILRGYMDTWPAMRSERWQRYKMLKSYGKKAISSNSEAGIVYGGGRSNMKFKSFGRVVADMRSSGSRAGLNTADTFTFDADILNSIPELRNDFDVPEVFSRWANPAAEAEGSAWHILSLGASRTGLPFHTHGESWLGLVHGLKMWYIYPPGTGPPLAVLNSSSPLTSVAEWVSTVLPTLRDLPFASTSGDSGNSDKGYRPIECLQRPGDIMYVPSGWSHQTINVGEALGVGAQRVFGGKEKEDIAEVALKRSLYNIEALKMKAVAMAHQGLDEENRVRRNISAATLGGMVRIRTPLPGNAGKGEADEFTNLVLDGEDTWILQFMPSRSVKEEDQSVPAELKVLAKMWNDVAQQLKGVISVGLVEQMDIPETHSIDPLIPKIVVSFGDERTPGMTAAQVVSQGVEYKGHRDAEEIVNFALQEMAARPRAREGSVTAVGAKARRLYNEAEKALRELLRVQPEHPEAWNLLVETLGYSARVTEQMEAADQAATVFERMVARDTTGKFSAAVSSFYHQLASCFLATENPRAALPLLERSKQISPTYLAAAVDTIGAYHMMKDEKGAERALEAALEAGVPPNHPEIKRVTASGGKLTQPRPKGQPKLPPSRRVMKRSEEL